MKTLFIEAIKPNLSFNPSKLTNLPNELHILYSIQYNELAEKIKQYLMREHQILGFEQVLGCSQIHPKASLLLIGSGRFHAINLAYSTGQEVYVYDFNLTKITKEEIAQAQKTEKAKLSLFANAEKIGILVSIKPGQKRLKEAEALKIKIEKKFKKKVYLFLADNINIGEFENFDINFWINTSCPGLELDSMKILDYKKLNL